MSWSLPFNGKRSIISDSYHRLAITVSLEDLTNQDFQESIRELALTNLLHFNVLIPPNYSTSIGNQIQNLKHLEQDVAYAYRSSESSFAQTARPLFVSIHIRNDAFQLATELLSSEFDANLLIVDMTGEKHTSLRNIHEMHRLVRESGKKTVLGVSSCEGPMELDWYLSKITRGTIHMVHLGDIALPNMHLHSIELVHTMGLTSMVSLTHRQLETEIAQSPMLSELAAKYAITPDVFLVKCLLQLGCVISLPFSYYSPASVERAASVSRLTHPFVHRKQFVSMFRIISLSIAQEDLQVLISQSETEEAKSDAFWTPHATSRSADRVLSYQK